MAKKKDIIGRTELLAAIYDPDNLPTAVVHGKGMATTPYCLHSLRKGDLSDFEFFFTEACEAHGLDPKKDFERATFVLWRFFEDFPNPTYNCVGCNRVDACECGHEIEDSESYCTCGTEELA